MPAHFMNCRLNENASLATLRDRPIWLRFTVKTSGSSRTESRNRLLRGLEQHVSKQIEEKIGHPVGASTTAGGSHCGVYR